MLLSFGARHSVAKTMDSLVGSEILAISAEITRLRQEGHKVLNFTVGDFASRLIPIPPLLVKLVAAAYKSGETNYPPSSGVLELRQAVVGLYQQAGLEYPLESILITGGARPGLYAAFRTLLNPGDGFVYPVPSWNNNHYAHLCAARGIPILCTAKNRFQPTPGQIQEVISDAKVVVLNSPSNPAGTTLSSRNIFEISRVVLEENKRRKEGPPVYLVYDQVYWGLQEDPSRHCTPPGITAEMAPYTIIVDGISKNIAATGLRVGWVAVPPQIMRKMQGLVGHMGAWAPRPEQVALAQFISQGHLPAAVTQTQQKVQARLSVLYKGLTRAGIECLEPQGGIYISVRLPGEDARRVLLQDYGLGVVPFSAFGLKESDWYRMSVGSVTLKECEQAVRILKQFTAAR